MADIQIVYRWEDARGRGPYHQRYKIYDDEGGVFNRWRHIVLPSPACDFIPKMYNYRCGASCGFVSLEQESNWFLPEERAFMKQLGLSLATYAVPATCVRIGKYQCQFLKWKAMRIV